MGRECVVGVATRGSNTGGGENFRTHPDRPGAYHPPVHWEKFSFRVVKRTGPGVDNPSQSGTEVKEREELYLYSPFVPT